MVNAILRQAIHDVPGCIAAGLVDLPSRGDFTIETVDSHPHEVLKLLAQATSEIFEGPNVLKMESVFKQARGTEDDPSHYFQEIVIVGDYLIHILIRSQVDQDRVACFACRKTSTLSELLDRSRAALHKLEAALDRD